MTPAFPRRVRRCLAPLALLACLAACSSPIPVVLQSSTPQAIDSVLVLFGPEADFADKSSTVEIAGVIQPSKLGSYYGFAEFAVTADDIGTVWTKRSADLEALRVRYTVAKGDTRRLSLRLPRSKLDQHADLGMAVVVRTTDRQYRMKAWKHTALNESDEDLVIDVRGDDIIGSF